MDLRELESLYDAFAPAGYAFALQLTRDSDAAQDLVQSVFLRLAKRPRFTILNPRSFVLRCIYRAHVDVVRRDATRQQMLENFAFEAQTVFRPEPSEDEKIAELLEQLAALPEEQRVVVHLKTWEQRTFRQIAGILGIPANTAASRYRMAHGRLPATLEDLVPAFLPSIPTDPLTGKPLCYKPSESSSYLIYGTGWDQTDNSGSSVTALTGLSSRFENQADWGVLVRF